MLFTRPSFLIFFVVVFCAHWLIRPNRSRKLLLLVASYVFYGAWDIRFLVLIFVSTLVDYVVALKLRDEESPRIRKRWLISSLVANLGILGFFKYYNFFVSSGQGFFDFLGIPVGDYTLAIILPVGISFFTFQSMSYTIDVYRGSLKPITSFTDFALFVSFFPQLVAGPIVRAATFLPQLSVERRLMNVPFKSAITLFILGFFKKACLADNMAVIVDQVYAAPEQYTSLSIIIAVVFFALQAYCDFSGYSDMAIAVARMLGFELCVNFNFPYFGANIREYWNRWHVSLSTWLRDYLYFSLGGNRGGKLFVQRNLFLTMLLGGLWHGASWNYLLWGALHGVALVGHREYEALIKPRVPFFRRMPRLVGIALTFYWTCGSLILFRAADLPDAALVFRAFLFWQSPGELALPAANLLVLPILGVVHWFGYRKTMEERVKVLPDFLCALLFGAATIVLLMFMPMEYKPFIYFQF